MRPLWLAGLSLTACEGPITNDVFYQDEAFLAALPSSERFAAPDGLAEAPEGGATFLAHGQAASTALQARLQPLVASGDALRRAAPAERSAVHRAWAPLPVAIQAADGSPRVWWVKAVVLLPEGGDATWTIERSRDRVGPWALAGAGQHGDGEGTLRWDDDTGALSASYGADEHGRFVEVAEGDRGWQLRGQAGIVFGVDDARLVAAPLPATALVVHSSDGGRAEGWLYVDEGQAPFVECWDAAGRRTWLGGDPMIPEQGAEAACTVGSLGVVP